MTPGQSLKVIRDLQELSQNALAELSGLPQSTISGMESGRISIGVERAKVLAKALRIHPAVKQRALRKNMHEHLFGTVWTRKDILERLPHETPSQLKAFDFPDGAIFRPLRSSIWMLNWTIWQMRFHQGTKT